MRALAITRPQASPAIRGIPGAEEAGLPGYESTFWFGLWVPAGTPAAIVQRLHEAAARSLAKQEVKDKIALQGMDAAPSTSPAAFDAQIKSETQMWERVVRDSWGARGIALDGQAQSASILRRAGDHKRFWASSRHIDRFCLSQDVPPANVAPASLDGLAFDQVHFTPQDKLQCLLLLHVLDQADGHGIEPESRDKLPSDGLQTAYLRQSAHFAIERERGEFGLPVVVGDQAVKQAAAGAGLQGSEHACPVQGRHQTALEHAGKRGARVGFGHAVVMLQGDIGLADNLIRREHLGIVALD